MLTELQIQNANVAKRLPDAQLHVRPLLLEKWHYSQWVHHGLLVMKSLSINATSSSSSIKRGEVNS